VREIGLKIRWPQGREGSSPSPGTNHFNKLESFILDDGAPNGVSVRWVLFLVHIEQETNSNTGVGETASPDRLGLPPYRARLLASIPRTIEMILGCLCWIRILNSF
jgi:hypothetical protein